MSHRGGSNRSSRGVGEGSAVSQSLLAGASDTGGSVSPEPVSPSAPAPVHSRIASSGGGGRPPLGQGSGRHGVAPPASAVPLTHANHTSSAAVGSSVRFGEAITIDAPATPPPGRLMNAGGGYPGAQPDTPAGRRVSRLTSVVLVDKPAMSVGTPTNQGLLAGGNGGEGSSSQTLFSRQNTNQTADGGHGTGGGGSSPILTYGATAGAQSTTARVGGGYTSQSTLATQSTNTLPRQSTESSSAPPHGGGSLILDHSGSMIERGGAATGRARSNSMAVDGMTMSFRDVVMVRPKGLAGNIRSIFNKDLRPELLVQQACGFFEAGTLNAIGAIEEEYADALLDALCGRRIPTTGNVLANGLPVVASTFRRIVGFVGRTSAAVRGLTVGQNITFAAEMRSASYHSDTEQGEISRDNVEIVMTMMGFEKTTLAEDLDEIGKIKLELAMELVLDPPVIFLRQPLKELPSHQSAELCELLRRTARILKKTVILTTRSFPMPLWERIDNLTVLGHKGHCLYSGTRDRMQGYYTNLKLSPHCLSLKDEMDRGSRASLGSLFWANEPGGLVAPWAKRQATSLREEAGTGAGGGSPGGGSSPITPGLLRRDSALSASGAGGANNNQQHHHLGENRPSPTLGPSVPHAADRRDDSHRWLVVSDGDVALDLAELWSDREVKDSATTRYAAAYYDSKNRQESMNKHEESQRIGARAALYNDYHDQDDDDQSYHHRRRASEQQQHLNFAMMLHQPPSTSRRLLALSIVHGRRGMKSKETLLATLTLFVLFGFTAWLMGRQNSDQAGMQNTRGIIFFMFWVALELNIYFIQALLDDLQLFLQHRDGGYYGLGLFMTTLFTRFMIQRLIMLVPLGFFVFLVLTSQNELLWLLGLCSMAHIMLVFLIVCILMNSSLSTLVCIVIDAYMVIFSGFLYNLASLPLAVAKTSLIRFGYGGAVHHDLEGKPWACDANLLAQNFISNTTNVTSYCYTGDEYVESQGFQDDSLESNSLQLMLITFGLLFLCLFRIATLPPV